MSHRALNPVPFVWMLEDCSLNQALRKEILQLLGDMDGPLDPIAAAFLKQLLSNMDHIPMDFMKYCMSSTSLLQTFIRKAIVLRSHLEVLTELLEQAFLRHDELAYPSDNEQLEIRNFVAGRIQDLSKSIETSIIMRLYLRVRQEKRPALFFGYMLEPHISNLVNYEEVKTGFFYEDSDNQDFLRVFLIPYTLETKKQYDIQIAVLKESLYGAVKENISKNSRSYNFLTLALEFLKSSDANSPLCEVIFPSLSYDSVNIILNWAYTVKFNSVLLAKLLRLHSEDLSRDSSFLAKAIVNFGEDEGFCNEFLISFIKLSDKVDQPELELCIGSSPWLLQIAIDKYRDFKSPYRPDKIFRAILKISTSSWWREAKPAFQKKKEEYTELLRTFAKSISGQLAASQIFRLWTNNRDTGNEIIFQWALEGHKELSKNTNDYGTFIREGLDDDDVSMCPLQKLSSTQDLVSAIKSPSKFTVASETIKSGTVEYSPIEILSALLTVPFDRSWEAEGLKRKDITDLIEILSGKIHSEDAVSLSEATGVPNIRKYFLLMPHYDSLQSKINTFCVPLSRYQTIRSLQTKKDSNVFKAKDTITGKVFAVKEISTAGKCGERAENELEIMTRLDSPHTLKMKSYSVASSMSHVYIMTEFAPGGSLYSRTKETLSADLIQNYAAQIICGLEYLHSLNIVHRDLKPLNIFVYGERLVIADFGLSIILEPGQYPTKPAGTPGYIAPEVILRKKYGKSADFFSLGCTLYALATGKHSFNGRTDDEILTQTLESEPNYDLVGDQLLRALIFNLLRKDPSHRLGHCCAKDPLGTDWQKVKRHPFFKNFEWSKLPFELKDE